MANEKEKKDNVVSIFSKPTKKVAKESETYDFEETMKRNAENKRREEKERIKANRVC